MSRPMVKLPLHDRLLLRGADVAALLGISPARWVAWHAEYLIPAPVKINGVPRWRTREIADWIAAGCPERADWNWEPTVPIRLDEFVRVLQNKISDAEARLREVNARLAAGETHVGVSRA
jgi:predicted DNA-binding transcriptional regulator AlpA